MPKPVADYARFVCDEVFKRTPGNSMREHAAGWRNVLRDIYWAGVSKEKQVPGASGGGLFEVTAIVISRWEFLGGLYCGETEKTDVKHAAAYARRFLPQYNNVHNLSHDPNCSDDICEFFGMLRNKPLHGFTPAGVFTHDKKGVMAWNLGASVTHLTLAPQGVLVDCLTLAEDLCKSMEDFSLVLDRDSEPAAVGTNTTLIVDHRSPGKRWIRAFWARFCPIGFKDTTGAGMAGHEAWMKFGETGYGIPT